MSSLYFPFSLSISLSAKGVKHYRLSAISAHQRWTLMIYKPTSSSPPSSSALSSFSPALSPLSRFLSVYVSNYLPPSLFHSLFLDPLLFPLSLSHSLSLTIPLSFWLPLSLFLVISPPISLYPRVFNQAMVLKKCRAPLTISRSSHLLLRSLIRQACPSAHRTWPLYGQEGSRLVTS